MPRLRMDTHPSPILPIIPDAEFWITYARSSGPGGQNVNKRETKAVVRWNVDHSPLFTEHQKDLIRGKLANRINSEGYLVVDAEAQRSQEQNRAFAMQRIRDMVCKAITPETKRIATRPSRSAKRKRLDEKTLQGRKKAARRPPSKDE